MGCGWTTAGGWPGEPAQCEVMGRLTPVFLLEPTFFSALKRSDSVQSAEAANLAPECVPQAFQRRCVHLRNGSDHSLAINMASLHLYRPVSVPRPLAVPSGAHCAHIPPWLASHGLQNSRAPANPDACVSIPCRLLQHFLLRAPTANPPSPTPVQAAHGRTDGQRRRRRRHRRQHVRMPHLRCHVLFVARAARALQA